MLCPFALNLWPYNDRLRISFCLWISTSEDTRLQGGHAFCLHCLPHLSLLVPLGDRGDGPEVVFADGIAAGSGAG